MVPIYQHSLRYIDIHRHSLTFIECWTRANWGIGQRGRGLSAQRVEWMGPQANLLLWMLPVVGNSLPTAGFPDACCNRAVHPKGWGQKGNRVHHVPTTADGPPSTSSTRPVQSYGCCPRISMPSSPTNTLDICNMYVHCSS